MLNQEKLKIIKYGILLGNLIILVALFVDINFDMYTIPEPKNIVLDLNTLIYILISILIFDVSTGFFLIIKTNKFNKIKGGKKEDVNRESA